MIRTLHGAAVVLVLLACAHPARAGLISFNATPYTGAPAAATVTLNDATTPGSVWVTVTTDPLVSYADINGFFFNLRNESLLPGLTATGDITLTVRRANAVTSAGPGNNINGGGMAPFDVGLQIGTPGIGKDDIRSTTFLLSVPGVTLTDDMFTAANASGDIFAIRLTSVGPAGSSRNGSSKLRNSGGSPPTTPEGPPPVATPEPSTLAGFLLLGTLGLFARRLRG